MNPHWFGSLDPVGMKFYWSWYSPFQRCFRHALNGNNLLKSRNLRRRDKTCKNSVFPVMPKYRSGFAFALPDPDLLCGKCWVRIRIRIDPNADPKALFSLSFFVEMYLFFYIEKGVKFELRLLSQQFDALSNEFSPCLPTQGPLIFSIKITSYFLVLVYWMMGFSVMRQNCKNSFLLLTANFFCSSSDLQ